MTFKPRSPRYQTERLPIMVRSVGTFVWGRGIVLNLSTTGVQIYSNAKLTAGGEVEMEFVTVDKQGRKNRRKMRAKIVWANGSRYGCQFMPTSRA